MTPFKVEDFIRGGYISYTKQAEMGVQGEHARLDRKLTCLMDECTQFDEARRKFEAEVRARQALEVVE